MVVSSARRFLPWVWTVLIGVVAVLLAVFAAPEFEGPEAAFAVVFLGAVMFITAIGSVVTARRPGNRIAWLLHVIASSLLLTIWADTLVGVGPPESPGFLEFLALLVASPAGMTAMYSIFLLLFVFPAGRFLTRRWKWAGWAGSLLVPATWIVSIFSVEVGDPWATEPWAVPNPIGVLSTEAMESLFVVWPPFLLAMVAGGVGATVVRFRRGDLLVRTQIKWVLFASVVTLVSFPLAFAELGVVSEFLTAVVLNAVPVAAAVAVVRYKLFEIDRIISRTISYILVIGLLAMVFATGVIWIPSVLGIGDQPVLVAGSTLAVAALFNPLRRRVQSVVDHRFNRSKYEAEVLSEQFATELSLPHTIEEIAALWKGTVDESLQPGASGIWLKPD